MLKFIAHAGEAQEKVTENSAHFLENWYFALPLFAIVVLGLAAAVYIASKRSVVATYLSVVVMLLLSGVYFYDKSPVLSAVAITVGLVGSLLCVLASLSDTHTSAKK